MNTLRTLPVLILALVVLSCGAEAPAPVETVAVPVGLVHSQQADAVGVGEVEMRDAVVGSEPRIYRRKLGQQALSILGPERLAQESVLKESFLDGGQPLGLVRERPGQVT